MNKILVIGYLDRDPEMRYPGRPGGYYLQRGQQPEELKKTLNGWGYGGGICVVEDKACQRFNRQGFVLLGGT